MSINRRDPAYEGGSGISLALPIMTNRQTNVYPSVSDLCIQFRELRWIYTETIFAHGEYRDCHTVMGTCDYKCPYINR